jgi:hypothetical protein
MLEIHTLAPHHRWRLNGNMSGQSIFTTGPGSLWWRAVLVCACLCLVGSPLLGSDADDRQGLIRLLKSDDEDERALALQGVLCLRKAAAGMEEDLWSGLASEDSELRRSYYRALAKLGARSERDVQRAIEAIARERSRNRIDGCLSAAVELLVALGEDSDAVMDALVEVFGDEQGEHRLVAAQALLLLGFEDEDASLTVHSALRSGDARDQLIALGAVKRLGPRGKPFVDSLVAGFPKFSPDARVWDLTTLGIHGLDSEKVRDLVASQVKSEDRAIRIAAITSQALLTGEFKGAVAFLSQELARAAELPGIQAVTARCTILSSLGMLALHSEAATACLLSEATRGPAEFRTEVATLLIMAGQRDEAVVAIVLKDLASRQAVHRWRCLHVVEECSLTGPPVEDSLTRMLDSEDPAERIFARYLLAR